MPKNQRAAGGRAPKNFDPRYGERATAKKASRPGIGRTHRGYREEPAETQDKRRWSPQERAGRDEARGIRSQATGRGDRVRPADDRGAGRSSFAPRDDRGARRDDRGGYQRRDDRGGDQQRGGFQQRGERGGFERRDDRAGDRGGYQRRDDRAGERGGDRGGFQRRDDRAGDRGGFQRRDDRAGERTGDRGGYQRRDDRTGDRAGQRGGFERRDDRAGQRGGFERRDDRGGRPFERRDDRGSERSGFQRRDDRVERSSERRDERPARATTRGESSWEKGRTERTERSAAPKQHQQHDDVVHDRLQSQAIIADEVSDVTFGDLGLGQNIVGALAELGAARPFPVQAASIPSILEGRDVLARGRTGSGKTIAFGAPLVENVLRSASGGRREFGRRPRALILAPTRELALQIDKTIQPIARSVGLFTTQIYGGVPQGRQVGALRKGVDIIIGTPGRIEDLEKQGKLDLSDIRVVVLDEADHMCELGFVEPVQRILRLTADKSQKLLFSATLDREVAALVDEFLVEPAVYEVAGESQDTGTIDHRVLVIDHRDKADILNALVDRAGKTLVFSRTRAFTEMLVEQFEDAGIAAVALHGDLNQAKRTRNLERMTSGRVNVLVATDVAARGIHVDDIDLVIQADPATEYKTYLHRSGRTGRAGRAGRVVTLVPRARARRMEELLQRAEIEAPFESARPGDDVIDEIAGRSLTVDELTKR